MMIDCRVAAVPGGLGPPQADRSEAEPVRDGYWLNGGSWLTAPRKIRLTLPAWLS